MSNSDELVEETRGKINIDPRQLFSDSLGSWCLACPVCEDIHTHVESVFTRIGTDEYEAAIYKGTKVRGKTDERRSALVCVFRCEQSCRFELVFQQHKGNNHIEVNRLKDAPSDEGPEVPDNFAPEPRETKQPMVRKPMKTPTAESISLRRNAVKTGELLLRHKEAFNKAYQNYSIGIPACGDANGFFMLEKFRHHIKTYVFDYKRGNNPGIKHAAGEMFRLIAVEKADYTMRDMESFVKWYGELRHKIGNHLSDVIESRGDDGYGDLCDSLPLAGTSVVQRILADGYETEEDLEQSVLAQLGSDWAKFLLHGENYVEMRLMKQAKKWFLHFLLAEKDE